MIRGAPLLLCWRGAVRPALRAPGSSVAGLLSVALGVAVFLAVTIANRSASESFRSAFAMVTGRADLEIRGNLPETLLPQVAACDGVAAASPLVETTVTLPDHPGESLRLAGIDPFTAEGLIGFRPPSGEGSQLTEWLSGNDGLAVTPEFLTRHGLRKGDTLRLQGAGPARTVTISEVLKPEAAAAAANVAATDIANAQEWTGNNGKLTAILVRLSDPASPSREAVATRLRGMVRGDVTVEPPARRTDRVEAMLAAFRLNLTALSLVSLLVGMFFVGNAASGAVVRRRVSLGILRAVGGSRGDLQALVLSEAALTGALGAGLGFLLSPMLAGVMAAPVARTISSLYLPVDAHGGWPSPSEAAAGIAAGIAAALIAAWIPARQAGRLDPTRVLHPGTAPEIFPVRTAMLARLGLVSLAAAALFSVAALAGGPPVLGFGAAFLVLAGSSLTVPAAMARASGMLAALLPRGPRVSVVRLALGQTMSSLHRTAPTAAALAAAAAMTVGIGVMIHSFRGSVIDWVGRTLTADLFIAPATNERLGLEHVLPPGSAAWWRERGTVESVGTFRELEARTAAGESVTIGLVEGPARGAVDFLHGGGEEKKAALEAGGCTALSESLARRLRLGPGDELVLAGPVGPLKLRVLDLYRDYTRDRGIAMVGAEAFRRGWDAPGEHSLAVKFRPGVSADRIERERKEFVRAFGGGEAFACYGNASLKARILQIFEQTFAVTAVLRAIAIAVAVGGVMLTLGIVVLERTRDLSVLRSLGASPAQITCLVLAEAGFLGVVAGLVGLVSGTMLSLVLTWVINRAFFGWSIDLSFPMGEMALLPLWMGATALIAGLLPALRAAKIPPAEALRME